MVVAAVAAAVAAIAAVSFLPSLDVGSRATVSDLIEPLAAGALSDELWPQTQVRFRSAGPDFQGLSFELGVLMVGIAVNLEESRREEAKTRIDSALELLSASGLLSPDTKADEIDQYLGRKLDPVYFSLGKWVEAGRLAARTGDIEFLDSEAFLQEERFLLGSKLPSETRRELESVREITKTVQQGDRRRRLEDIFTRILLARSRG